MDHLAIMTKSWHLIPKILSGEKGIESRWYLTRRAPWNSIRENDMIYFKNSGEPVSARACVEKVLQFDHLTPEKVKQLLTEFGGIGKISIKSFENSFEFYKNKKYCILIFLKNPEKIPEFEIDKKGFGSGAAWLTMENIEKIKKE